MSDASPSVSLQIPAIPPVTAPAAPGPGAARTRLLLAGPIVPTLLRLAAPNVVVNLILIAVTATVDAHFVGRLGSDALAGLSLVFPLIMLMQQMANSSMGGAIASAVARSIGAGKHEDASALVVHAVIIAAGMAALFSAVLLLGGRLLYGLMGGQGSNQGAMLDAALQYSNAIFAGAFAYWLLSTLTSVVRGTGQGAILAVVYIAAEVLHIALVPVLVFGVGPVPALGVTGAGIATVTSFTASTVALLWYLAAGRTAVKLSWRGVTLSRRLFVEILRVGAPMSAQPILNNLTLATLTGFVGVLGAPALAAFGAAVRLEYLIYPLSFGLGAGLLSMVGTAIGAGQRARAIRVAWIGAALAACVTGAIGVFGASLPGVWAGFFTAVPEIRAQAATYLVISSLAYPCLGLGLALSAACQGAGRPLWPLIGIGSRALVVAVAGWIATHWIAVSLPGLATVAASGMVVYGTALVLAVRSGAWARR